MLRQVNKEIPRASRFSVTGMWNAFFFTWNLGQATAHYALETPWNWAWNDAKQLWFLAARASLLAFNEEATNLSAVNDFNRFLFLYVATAVLGAILGPEERPVLRSYPAHIVEVVKAFFFCLMLLRSTRLLQSRDPWGSDGRSLRWTGHGNGFVMFCPKMSIPKNCQF